VTDNRLIHGDNLPALKSLVQEMPGAFQCAYLDPPYNTGEAQRGASGAGYSDRYDRAEWREMMVARLRLVRDLLSEEGSLFVQLDDNELDTLKLALDEIFGRPQFINRITVAARSPSAFSTVNPGVFKASEYILWYAKSRSRMRAYPLRIPRDPDRAYALWLENPADPVEAWRVVSLRGAFPAETDLDSVRVHQAAQVCRLATISNKKAGRAILAAKERSREQPERVLRVERDGLDPQFVLRGQQLIFYDKQVSLLDGVPTATRPLTNIWTDIPWEGIAKEGGVQFKTGKKPEKLLRRCLQLCTRPGDWVLDPFSGSGTTAAVAHKMGRAWIAMEAGAIHTASRERLKRVVEGADPHGISSMEGWSGGGTFSCA